jgi:hypothetical protein
MAGLGFSTALSVAGRISFTRDGGAHADELKMEH